MEKTLKNMIFEFIEDCFEIDFKVFMNYEIKDKDGGYISIRELNYLVMEFFSVESCDEMLVNELVLEWIDNESVKFNNMVVDIQNRMYSDSGQVPRQIPTTPEQIQNNVTPNIKRYNELT